jgi:hypothetical protein
MGNGKVEWYVEGQDDNGGIYDDYERGRAQSREQVELFRKGRDVSLRHDSRNEADERIGLTVVV